MNYECKTVPLIRLIATSRGFIKPLCETCQTLDCTNPIEKRKVSILGVTKEIKVFSSVDEANIVILCDGFSR
jgi:hypothetical protein